MELAFLLRGVDAEVVWITNQKPVEEEDEVVKVLEKKMLDRGVQVKIISSNSFLFILSSNCRDQSFDSSFRSSQQRVRKP